MKITSKLNYNDRWHGFADKPADNYRIWLCRDETEQFFPIIKGKDSFTLTVANKRQHKKGEKKITLLRYGSYGSNRMDIWNYIRYNGEEVFISNQTGKTVAQTFNVTDDVDEMDLWVNITV